MHACAQASQACIARHVQIQMSALPAHRGPPPLQRPYDHEKVKRRLQRLVEVSVNDVPRRTHQNASWAKMRSTPAHRLQGKSVEEYFGRRFYEILSDRYPTTKSLFSNAPPKQQARALSKMLSMAVALLTQDLHVVVAQLKQLAVRHHRYGTNPQHYGPVGECLVATIAEVLGDDFDATAADAWVHLYSTVCVVMLPVTHQMCMKEVDNPDPQE
eukprot:jgi/Ulvmu1/7921/UM004_0153.1